jgi:hypothetical protein
VRRLDAVVLLAFELLRRVLDLALLDRALPDDPLLFVDLFVLEFPRDELLLEDRVVCAIVSRLSWLSVPAAPFAPAVRLLYPLCWGFELPQRVFAIELPHRVFEMRDAGNPPTLND